MFFVSVINFLLKLILVGWINFECMEIFIGKLLVVIGFLGLFYMCVSVGEIF